MLINTSAITLNAVFINGNAFVVVRVSASILFAAILRASLVVISAAWSIRSSYRLPPRLTLMPKVFCPEG